MQMSEREWTSKQRAEISRVGPVRHFGWQIKGDEKTIRFYDKFFWPAINRVILRAVSSLIRPNFLFFCWREKVASAKGQYWNFIFAFSSIPLSFSDSLQSILDTRGQPFQARNNILSIRTKFFSSFEVLLFGTSGRARIRRTWLDSGQLDQGSLWIVFVDAPQPYFSQIFICAPDYKSNFKLS